MFVTVVQSTSQRGDVGNAVTGAFNPANDRRDSSRRTRMNKICL